MNSLSATEAAQTVLQEWIDRANARPRSLATHAVMLEAELTAIGAGQGHTFVTLREQAVARLNAVRAEGKVGEALQLAARAAIAKLFKTVLPRFDPRSRMSLAGDFYSDPRVTLRRVRALKV